MISDDLVSWSHDWGQLLRSARQVAGLSLADLSARTGLSRGYLSKLESGQDGARNPSRATLVALARALPSFRPLAYQLEPVDNVSPNVSLAHITEEIQRPPRLLIARSAESTESMEPEETEHENAPEPIQLGWRELETLVAFLALERSALPTPITARIISRAVDRPTDSVIATLERLTNVGALSANPPRRPGDAPTYTYGPSFESCLGLSRLGDALVLAAALLTHAAPARNMRSRSDEADKNQ
jgi:transcriptional regulator with XRE-family HTH domain